MLAPARTPLLLASLLLVLALAPPASATVADGPDCLVDGSGAALPGLYSTDCSSAPISCPANTVDGCAVRYHLELSFDGARAEPCVSGLSGASCWGCAPGPANCGVQCTGSASTYCTWDCTTSLPTTSCTKDYDIGDHLAAGATHGGIHCFLNNVLGTSYRYYCRAVLEYTLASPPGTGGHGHGHGHANGH